MYNPIDFAHEKDIGLDDLILRMKAYYTEADFDLLKKAYHFSTKAHKGQKRSSGEDYIIHPINVAATLIKLKMDMNSIISGLLHDVLEDCDISPKTLEKEFGREVTQIVFGLTKISKIKFKTIADSQAENFRKMIVAMAKDIRVIVVKMADRMHNMRTLQYVSEERQRKVAQETLDIYIPLAGRLGINSVKENLEDLCLRFLHADIYYRLTEKMSARKKNSDDYIKKVVDLIQEKLREYSVKANCFGHPKHFYSIYRKMVNREIGIEQVQDLLNFVIISNNITECYKILGIIHSNYIPIPGRFKDYIAIPKVNGYQSLHTTVIGPQAERIEIQIRTYEMNEIAEIGIAAHCKYNEEIIGKNVRPSWMEDLLEVDKNVTNSSEFMDVVKSDLDVGGVFVFSPNGDVRELCYNATPIDFAYSVHTEVGNHCVGAKVNNRMVPLRHILKSGDTVEILTSENQTPSKDWLTIVKTPRARTRIRQWLLRTEKMRKREIGRNVLEKAFQLFGTSLKKIQESGEMKYAMEKFNASSEEDIFLFVGSEKYSTRDIIRAIPTLRKHKLPDNNDSKIKEINSYSKKLQRNIYQKANKQNAIIVNSTADPVIKLAKCCAPIPGDPIIGYITKEKNAIVHTKTCIKGGSEITNKTLEVEWNPESRRKHSVNIRVVTEDQPGILSLVSKNIAGMNVNIKSVIARSRPDKKGAITFEIEVQNNVELLKVISSIETLEEIISVSRV